MQRGEDELSSSPMSLPEDMLDRIVPSDEVLRRYGDGERDFSSLHIEDLDGATPLRGALLDGATFTGTFMVADFEGASLRGARLDGANLKTCSFTAADLSGADFSGSALCSTTFVAARTVNASFEGAYFHSYVLRRGEIPNW